MTTRKRAKASWKLYDDTTTTTALPRRSIEKWSFPDLFEKTGGGYRLHKHSPSLEESDPNEN
jgi:hypothetical protein